MYMFIYIYIYIYIIDPRSSLSIGQGGCIEMDLMNQAAPPL